MKEIEVPVQLILKFIEQGKTKAELCDYLNVDVEVIDRYMLEYGVQWTHNCCASKHKFKVHPEIDREWLVKNWLDTDYTMPQLAEMYHVTLSLLESRRACFNLHKPYKYKVNASVLFNAEDPNIAYIAGLLNTDGYFPKAVDSFEISLVGESERALLQDIANYIGATAPIGKYGNAYRLRVVQPGVRSFFKDNYNIALESKTYETPVPLNFPSEACAKAYVRGCLDVDGCIGNTHYRLTLSTASETFVKGLRALVFNYTGVLLTYYQEKRGSSHYPTVSARGKRAQRVLDWIYSENGLRLERKYKKYIQVKDIV